MQNENYLYYKILCLYKILLSLYIFYVYRLWKGEELYDDDQW